MTRPDLDEFWEALSKLFPGRYALLVWCLNKLVMNRCEQKKPSESGDIENMSVRRTSIPRVIAKHNTGTLFIEQSFAYLSESSTRHTALIFLHNSLFGIAYVFHYNDWQMDFRKNIWKVLRNPFSRQFSTLSCLAVTI